jgi:hypothetical protein
MAARCCVIAEMDGADPIYLAQWGEWTTDPKKAVRFSSLSSAPKYPASPRKGYKARIILDENMSTEDYCSRCHEVTTSESICDDCISKLKYDNMR